MLKSNNIEFFIQTTDIENETIYINKSLSVF